MRNVFEGSISEAEINAKVDILQKFLGAFW